MGKKCIPGVICVENMTLFMLFIVFILLVYIFVRFSRQSNVSQNNNNQISVLGNPYMPATYGLATISTQSDPFNDPYSPPLKNNGIYYPSGAGDIRGMISNAFMGGVSQQHTVMAQPTIMVQPVVPVNVQTRRFNPEYIQMGILTRNNGSDLILSLMGRQSLNGRSRYQYYTISNTGSINTKLPVKVRGKSCSNEYGCDEITSGDTVYVDGYNDTFVATIYENSLLSYIPL